MPEGLLPLLAGTALALVALVFVLYPFAGALSEDQIAVRNVRTPHDSSHIEEQSSAIVALREIEFDRETGKLSDSDYEDLKERYTKLALTELRTSKPASSAKISVSNGDNVDDAVEAAIANARLKQKSCTNCGPRGETDALYCSSCGLYLPGACSSCGAEITQVASRFCMTCGHQLGELEHAHN